jgi:hypothetical protein
MNGAPDAWVGFMYGPPVRPSPLYFVVLLGSKSCDSLVMNSSPYTPPSSQAGAFNCPYCLAYSSQGWIHLFQQFSTGHPFEAAAKNYHMSRCNHCRQVALWFEEKMIVPDVVSAVQPHKDIPMSLIEDFEEARSISQKSPRSAAALLRLCVQKLCKELGEPGENINADIASLVKKGLPVQVQQSLDIVRVIGNEQVHPGQLDVRDDPALVGELFLLINFIIEDRISRPKAIEALYQRLPASKLDGIKKRDA